jgi:SNF2 family DNA or RNA helicase
MFVPRVDVANQEEVRLREAIATNAPPALDVLGAQLLALVVESTSGTVNLEGVLAREPASNGSRRSPDKQARQASASAEAAPEERELSLARRLAYLLQPPLESLLSSEGPLEWPHEFFPFQRQGIGALYSKPALLLADDMGLGKTVQTIAAFRILVRTRRAESALLVVPASLVVQWRRAIRQWAPELRTSTISGPAHERAWKWKTEAHVYIVSYETLRADFTENLQSPPRRRVWDVVILDEAQKIKNRDSEISRECKQLQRRRAWALTGTPLENDIDDLASICEFVTPWEEGQDTLRLQAGPDLLQHHKDLQLRRKKEDVLPQLPPKTISEVILQIAGAQRASYDDAEKNGVLRLKELGQTIRITHVLELIQRLKQICNFCPQTGSSAKLDDLSERLDTLVAEGHRALVFSQYTDRTYGVAAMEERLGAMRPLSFTGALSTNERDRVIQTFKERPDHKVLLLSLRAGGQGLNLQEASYVFHFDRWWNPAIENQAEDRAHRLGQLSPVTVYKYICEDTIEERIDAILRQKQALFDQLVDDVSIDLRKHLTGTELFGLFGLEAPQAERGARREPPRYGGMTGSEFERYLADLLRRLEWAVELTPESRDGGIDLRATKRDQIGIQTSLYVQCKNLASPVSVEVIRELKGVLEPNVQGVVAAPSGFTIDAKRFAEQAGVWLWDGDHLSKLATDATGVPNSDLV